MHRKSIESLIKAGSFDRVAAPGGQPGRRAQLLEVLDRCLEDGQAVQRHRQAGQMSLFDLGVGPADSATEERLPDIPEFPPQQLLAMEKEVLGLYVSGHPLRQYQELLDAHACTPLATLPEQQDGARVTVGGLLAGLKQVSTRSGGNMAFLNLEDQTGQVEVVIFPRVLSACARYLEADKPLVVRGRLQNQEEEVKVLADEVLPATAAPRPARVEAAETGPVAAASEAVAPGAAVPATVAPAARLAAKVVYLKADAATEQDPLMLRLRTVLQRHRGETSVRIKLQQSDRWIEVHAHLRVTVTPELVAELQSMLGADAVVVR